jgi:hypothetical protein
MDIDLACDLVKSLGVNTKKWEYRPAQAVNQTDMLTPDDARARYKTKDYAKHLADVIVPSVCANFDKNNLGERLMAKSRAKEGKLDWDNLTSGEYKTIILGALLMRVGAKIKDKDLQHLRDLVPKVVCIPGTTWALEDVGFAARGKLSSLQLMTHMNLESRVTFKS